MKDIIIDSTIRQVLSGFIARKYRIIPKESSDTTLTFYTVAENSNETTKKELAVYFGKQIVLEDLKSEDIDLLISTHYSTGESTSLTRINTEDSGFLDSLINETIELSGSDIHIEPYENIARIRIRHNGHLVERYQVKKEKYPELINKVKIISNLDIAEKRLPQDGRIKHIKKDEKYDIRVSVLPTHHGEKAVLRVLGQDASQLDIEKLGFSENELAVYRKAISKPNGIVLLSGPTGSGKTTTLYATLKNLNQENVNITTIEDPVEYTLKGINQVQLNEKIGLNFSSAMRTFLRQDPDIIMVGEIRDLDTAKMAIRAALTGHLVFSTIHTNSAWGIFNRLVEMGIQPYLLAETLNTGIAQRLVRIFCPNCKKEKNNIEVLPEELQNVSSYFMSEGCTKCLGTGYSARKAIYEIIPGSMELLNVYHSQDTNISDYMQKNNLHSLKYNAIKMFEKGETSLDEIVPFLI